MLRRSLLLMLASTLAFACSDSTRPEYTLTGTWSLQTVNGQPLPFTLPETGEVVSAESLTLLASGRFTMTTTFRETINGNVTLESIPDAGTYVVSGMTLTLMYESDGSNDVGTVDGNMITLEDIGQLWAYRRD
jgi:hypothetical protein